MWLSIRMRVTTGPEINAMKQAQCCMQSVNASRRLLAWDCRPKALNRVCGFPDSLEPASLHRHRHLAL